MEALHTVSPMTSHVQLTLTISYASSDLSTLCVLFFIIFIGYSLAFYLVFGRSQPLFHARVHAAFQLRFLICPYLRPCFFLSGFGFLFEVSRLMRMLLFSDSFLTLAAFRAGFLWLVSHSPVLSFSLHNDEAFTPRPTSYTQTLSSPNPTSAQSLLFSLLPHPKPRRYSNLCNLSILSNLPILSNLSNLSNPYLTHLLRSQVEEISIEPI